MGRWAEEIFDITRMTIVINAKQLKKAEEKQTNKEWMHIEYLIREKI